MSEDRALAVLYTDGASLGNPGPAGAGFVLTDAGGETIAERGFAIGEATNNVAEYRALIAGLHEALTLGVTRIRVVSDSQLMCRQLCGRYRVKNARLQELHGWARAMLARFERFEITHCPREHNERADALAGEAARDSRRQLQERAGEGGR